MQMKERQLEKKKKNTNVVFLYTYFQENIKEMKVQNPEVKKKKKRLFGYSEQV